MADEVKPPSPAPEEKLYDQKPPDAPPPAEPPKEEPPKEEPPKAGDVKPESKVPEKYDLKLPEGSLLEEGAIERISAFAKQKGLTNDQAQSLLEEQNSAVSGYQGRIMEAHNKQVDAWAKEVEADPEVGGENYKKNVELASRVVKRFGDEELVKQLNKTGYGNYPGLVKLMTRIGKAMSEDQLVTGTPPTKKAPVAVEDKFYGSKS